MYPVSQRFLHTINENARRFYWTGTITTTAGQTYDFENKDIVKGSGYITRSCCGSSEIELGSVYAAELGILTLTDIRLKMPRFSFSFILFTRTIPKRKSLWVFLR